MNFDTRLLILGERAPDIGHLGRGIERKRVLSAVAATGAKVRHDSGGRLLVIETSDEIDEALSRALPGVTIVPLTEDVDERVPAMEPSDSLFVRALAIRNSADYREQKRRRTPGESPEEQLLQTAPCMPEG